MRETPGALIVAVFAWLVCCDGYFMFVRANEHNYREALTKSLLFLEAQRSGKLVRTRIPWRGDSAMEDGKFANLDLTGGYYDAGDNVKFGLPMAFTVTTLAWAALAYNNQLQAAGELINIQAAIRWGTDYFLKTAARKNTLWVQVGDPVADHECWVRPENMETPRTLYKIDQSTPGTEIAAETAAAMAASSIVFRKTDRPYARRLLNKAKLLFEFARNYKGTYDGECPFYCSYSGYNDELLWAASWLYIATRRDVYFKYITEEAITANVAEFGWDLKYAGAQVLLAGMNIYEGGGEQNFKVQADYFVCSIIPDSPFRQVYISPGGLIHIRDGANTQYVTGTAFLFSIYGDILARNHQTVKCGNQEIQPSRLWQFAKQQMDYILGSNPLGRSYMVGFGDKSPTQAHHRGSSVPVLPNGQRVNCGMSFVQWLNKDQPNPNELTGAIVGGPDRYDNFNDKRWNSAMLEPCTYINSLAVGALAKLAVGS
ncbi:endoglucanase 8 [Phalaenopsis equestris]|uniref:endoglucanase 8 n=1 Tax=Phalaenopsis equestris TaxID=78828 RepID=UPI0009E560E1|nr:endoglucanase 8 [Phalaenopsis equestris]